MTRHHSVVVRSEFPYKNARDLNSQYYVSLSTINSCRLYVFMKTCVSTSPNINETPKVGFIGISKKYETHSQILIKRSSYRARTHLNLNTYLASFIKYIYTIILRSLCHRQVKFKIFLSRSKLLIL